MRHIFYIVYEANHQLKVALATEWQGVFTKSPDQLLSAVQRAKEAHLKTVIVVGEKDAPEVTRIMEARHRASPISAYGFVVVAKEPLKYLQATESTPHLLDVMSEKASKKECEVALTKAAKLLQNAIAEKRQRINQETLRQLNEIFISLSAERNLEKLLATILVKSMELSGVDGGTLFVIEETDGDMYFRYRIQDGGGHSIHLEEIQSRVLESSISGYVALTGKVHRVDDVDAMKPNVIPGFTRGQDHEQINGVASLLSIPLKDSRNECRGVLQLANKRNGKFDEEDEGLMTAFATQAAVCLETLDIYGDVQRLFEGFVTAAITAIESRDPSTGGHSERVARMCVGLARATTEVNTGIYRSVRFKEEEIKELEYAALLHDFGKIGVREEVLVKAKKLYSYQLDAIEERIKTAKAAAKISYLEQKLYGSTHKEVDYEKQYEERVRQVQTYWDIIVAANEPNIMRKENGEILDRIRNEQLLLPDGLTVSLLTEEEYHALAIQQGSLTDSERLEIESHVRHTYQFLKMIPWTRDFKHLTEIAYCHHEKLDGTGYPRGLTSHEIPLQSKIMTIADIFDALTAADRWYKEAVPVERAVEILAHEVKEGKLDPVLYEIFVEKKVYLATHFKNLGNVA